MPNLTIPAVCQVYVPPPLRRACPFDRRRAGSAPTLAVVYNGLSVHQQRRLWAWALPRGTKALCTPLFQQPCHAALRHGAEAPAEGLIAYAAGFALMTSALHLAGIQAGRLIRTGALLRGLGGGTAVAGLMLAFGV